MKNEAWTTKESKADKIANTFKKVSLKVLLSLIVLGIVIGGIFAFAACDKTPEVPQQPPAIVQPDPSEEVDPTPGEDIEVHKTFEDFLESGLADDFVSRFATKVFEQKDGIMGKEYYVYGHDTVVTGMNFLYVYGDKTTEYRTVEIANIKFYEELAVDDILADINLSTSYRLSTQKVMRFNAKTNKLNPEVANALYSAANMQDQVLKLFLEVSNDKESYRTFTLFSRDKNNKIQLVELIVESDETTENLIENLADSTKVTVKNGRTYLSDNVIVFNEGYDLVNEDYEAEA